MKIRTSVQATGEDNGVNDLRALHGRIVDAIKAAHGDLEVTASNGGTTTWRGTIRLEQGWTRGVDIDLESNESDQPTRPLRVRVGAFTKGEQFLYGMFGLAIGGPLLVLGVAGVIPLPIGNLWGAIVLGVIGAGLGWVVGRPLRPLIIGRQTIQANQQLAREVFHTVEDVVGDPTGTRTGDATGGGTNSGDPTVGDTTGTSG